MFKKLAWLKWTKFLKHIKIWLLYVFYKMLISMSKISLQFSSSYEWAVVGFKWFKSRKDKEYRTTTNGQTVFIGKIDGIFSRFLTPMILIYFLNLNIQQLCFYPIWQKLSFKMLLSLSYFVRLSCHWSVPSSIQIGFKLCTWRRTRLGK